MWASSDASQTVTESQAGSDAEVNPHYRDGNIPKNKDSGAFLKAIKDIGPKEALLEQRRMADLIHLNI